MGIIKGYGNNDNSGRAPPIVRLPNSALGGATLWCPNDGYRLIYERVNINNYLCPHCFYEYPKPTRQGDPDAATISTIDGWVDVGLVDSGTKTAKFRPVEGHRKDAVVQRRFHPVLHPDTQKMIDKSGGSIKVTSSETKADSTIGVINTADKGKGYNGNKVRRKQYY